MSKEKDDVRVESPTMSDMQEEMERQLPPPSNYWAQVQDLCGELWNGFENPFVNSVWSLGEGSSTPEAQKHDHNQENPKRKQQDAKGKSTKKQKPSASGQQPKPKTEDIKKIIGEKSVSGAIKYVRDALNRQKRTDKLAYAKAIQMQWPTWPDVEGIEIKLNEIKSNNRKVAAKSSDTTTIDKAELKRTLVELRENLEKLKTQEQRLVEARGDVEKLRKQEREYSKKEMKLQLIFANNEKHSEETLAEKFYAEFPCLAPGEIASTGPTAAFSSLTNEVYAPDNNKVKVSYFQGLTEAMDKTTGWKTPDYLKPIATKIAKDVCENTESSYNLHHVLVCAAIKEMEDAKVENLAPLMLKKWGATLNKAKEEGFQVEYADDLLSKNLHAYFGRLIRGG